MTKNHNTRKHYKREPLFDYTLDTFEEFYRYAWLAMLGGTLASAVLILVVVYVL